MLKCEVNVSQNFPSNFLLDLGPIKQAARLNLGTQFVEGNLAELTFFLGQKLSLADNVVASKFLFFF